MITVQLFNQKATEFMNDLINSYPEIEQFKSFKASFTLLKNISETTPIKYFKHYFLVKYGDHIKNKNEQFFLNNEYGQDMQLTTNHSNEYWTDFINQLKNMWGTMSPENKDAIWNYLSILVIFAEKVSI